MIRIECKCRTCKTNAADLGLPFPLAAIVPERLAKMTKKPHGWVYAANEPGAEGEAVRLRTGIRAA